MQATPTTCPSSSASETIARPPGFRSNHHSNSSSPIGSPQTEAISWKTSARRPGS